MADKLEIGSVLEMGAVSEETKGQRPVSAETAGGSSLLG